ncbi:FCD domain-containing protein [Thermopolyspora sp. NPDC052614]|uniref:FadR/GntR family transcriptional regulator n=1 Tax=Thermopolyspora sp. NPDC052614 TaxID=3155682 RepID=UPI003419A4C7
MSEASQVAHPPPWERRAEKVSVIIAKEIVRDIARQRLAPGSILESEGMMLRRYRVARASLREALRILEIHGIIRIKPGPGGGPVVTRIDSGDFGRMATLFFQALDIRVAELMETRLILEPVMARLAAERRDPERDERLRALVRAGFDAGDADEQWRADHAFHDVILSTPGNRPLNLMAQAVRDIFVERVPNMAVTESCREGRRAHAAIAEAIVAGDADEAERLMRDHMHEYADAAALDGTLLAETVDWR